MTFDEWWKRHYGNTPIGEDNEAGLAAMLAWDARQAEVDRLAMEVEGYRKARKLDLDAMTLLVERDLELKQESRKLVERVRALEEALRPFARLAGCVYLAASDDTQAVLALPHSDHCLGTSAGDYRRAAALLAPAPAAEGGAG